MDKRLVVRVNQSFMTELYDNEKSKSKLEVVLHRGIKMTNNSKYLSNIIDKKVIKKVIKLYTSHRLASSFPHHDGAVYDKFTVLSFFLVQSRAIDKDLRTGM